MRKFRQMQWSIIQIAKLTRYIIGEVLCEWTDFCRNNDIDAVEG